MELKVTVKYQAHEKAPERVAPRQSAIASAIATAQAMGVSLTTRELGELLGISLPKLRTQLNILVEKGLVVRAGRRRVEGRAGRPEDVWAGTEALTKLARG